ncbi:MAG: hypothetical protein PGN33_21965 [Methylobacterium radiotolerans]
MAEKTELQKVQDAREAVAEAAAILLRNAEGLALLQMVVMTVPPGVHTVTRPGPAFLPDRVADDGYRRAVVAAAIFAGEHEAFDGLASLSRQRPVTLRLRRAVEHFVGMKWGARPPHASGMPEDIEARYGVKPWRVVAQAWRDHLTALALEARPKLKWVKAS